MQESETVALVGESGCGKSVSALSIMQLIDPPAGRIEAGEILYKGRDLLKLSEEEMRHVRGREIGMIFQEPMTSLNPVLTIGRQLTEEIKLRFALSLQLAIMASTVATLLAIPLGILAAVKQDTWIDYAVRVFSIAGLAMPSFWLGILLILTLLIVFKWLPPMVFTPFWVDP